MPKMREGFFRASAYLRVNAVLSLSVVKALIATENTSCPVRTARKAKSRRSEAQIVVWSKSLAREDGWASATKHFTSTLVTAVLVVLDFKTWLDEACAALASESAPDNDLVSN